jgi:hypothetical protein
VRLPQHLFERLPNSYLPQRLGTAGFFETIEPVNFNAIATPHCGLPQYPSLLSTITSKLVPRLMSRTGEQFFCADKWSPNGRPLLVVMADPSELLKVHYRLS